MRGHNGDPIDNDLTIHVHARGSFRGDTVAYTDTREDGTLIDSSATPLFFEVEPGGVRKALGAGVEDALGRSFPDLTPAEVASLPEITDWSIFDESGGHRLFVVGGKIRKFK